MKETSNFYLAARVEMTLQFLSRMVIQLPERQVKVLPETEITVPNVCSLIVLMFLPKGSRILYHTPDLVTMISALQPTSSPTLCLESVVIFFPSVS